MAVSDENLLAPGEAAVKNQILVRERRAALIRAAIEVFAAKGYHASRVSDVAGAAGMSQGTVYNYVGSKEDLLLMICEDHLRGYERIVTAALDGLTAPRDRLNALLRGTVDAIFSYRQHYLVMVRELHHIEKVKRRAFMRLAAEQRKICEDILRNIAAHEDIAIGNSLLMANLVVFLPSLLISRGWDLHGKVSTEEVGQFLIDFMLRGLGLARDAAPDM